MADIHIFEDIFAGVETILDVYITDTTANLAAFLAPVFLGLMTVYVAMWGYSMLNGLVQEPIMEGVRRILRLGFIIGLAVNTTIYNDQIVDLFYEGPTELAAAASGVPATPGAFATVLDNLMEKGFEIADRAWENAGIFDGEPGFYIIWAIVMLSTIAITLYVGFLVIFSKIGLALILGMGIFFIFMYLFPATQRFTEAWIAQLANYGLLLILAVGTGNLVLEIFDSYISAAIASSAGDVEEVDSILGILIVALISVLILRQVPSVASGLAGGVALATQGIVSRAMGGAGSAANRYLNPRERTRRAMELQRLARFRERNPSMAVRAGRAVGGAFKRTFGRNNSVQDNG